MKSPLLAFGSAQNSAFSSKSENSSVDRRKPCIGVADCFEGLAVNAPSVTVHRTSPMVVHPVRVLPSDNERHPAAASDGLMPAEARAEDCPSARSNVEPQKMSTDTPTTRAKLLNIYRSITASHTSALHR